MSYSKVYLRHFVGCALLWTTPVMAQDFIDFWCELAAASENQCHVFEPILTPEAEIQMEQLFEDALNKIRPIVNRTLKISPASNGKITSSPGGVDCGTQCDKYFVDGTSVTLTATPNTGYRFSGWQGACSGTSASVTLTISSDLSCSAQFVIAPTVESPPVVTPPDTTTPPPVVTPPDTTTPPPVVTPPDTTTPPTVVISPDTTTPPVVTPPNTITSPTNTPEQPVITVCKPDAPLQAVQSHVELTVGEIGVVKVTGGQERKLSQFPDERMVRVESFEGVGTQQFGIQLLPYSVGETALKVTDCTSREVTIYLTINPQPPKHCEAHSPLLAKQSEVIFMEGDAEKTIYFTGGLDDAKISRDISQRPNESIVRVAGVNRPAGDGLAVTLQPLQKGDTYLKVQDCSGEASMRIIVEKPNSSAINQWGKFAESRSYFKPMLKKEGSAKTVETYVHVEAAHRGKALEILYVLETQTEGKSYYQTWDSQNWRTWDAQQFDSLKISEVFSSALESLTTQPVKLPTSPFHKLYVGYRVEGTIVFYGMMLNNSGL